MTHSAGTQHTTATQDHSYYSTTTARGAWCAGVCLAPRLDGVDARGRADVVWLVLPAEVAR